MSVVISSPKKKRFALNGGCLRGKSLFTVRPMKFWSGLGQVLAVASLVLLATGCDPASGGSVSHEDDPDFVRGKGRLARKDLAGAILSFEQAIASNSANAAAHFEVALIFYSPSSGEKTDYVAACYHFQRHLSLQPDSKHADNISGFIKVCKKEIAKDIAMAPIPPSEINAIHSLRTQLAKANAENRKLCLFDDILDHRHGIGASRSRIARTIGEEHAVRLMTEHIFSRDVRWDHRDLTAEMGEIAEDVPLGSKIDRDHVELRIGLRAVAFAECPGRLVPGIGLTTTHVLCQVHAFEAGPAGCGLL